LWDDTIIFAGRIREANDNAVRNSGELRMNMHMDDAESQRLDDELSPLEVRVMKTGYKMADFLGLESWIPPNARFDA